MPGRDLPWGWVILSLALVAIGYNTTHAWERVKFRPPDRTITVTGSAKKRITSDLIEWSAQISTENADRTTAYKALHAYSPYHRVKDGTAYPAVFLLTGINDGRVDPMNTLKMAARLQAAGSKRPVLLRVSFDSGHGIGDNLSAAIDRQADVYAFLFEQLGMK